VLALPGNYVWRVLTYSGSMYRRPALGCGRVDGGRDTSFLATRLPRFPMKPITRRRMPLVIAIASALGAVATAQAAEPGRSLLDDKFMVSLGTFLLDTKTEISVNGSTGNSGTVVDLNRDLGLKDSDRFRLDATWRFAPRHKIRALYFDTNQSKTKTLERSLTIGDTVYPASASLTAENSTTITELAYEYVFRKKENYELTGSLGVHRVEFNFVVSGRGNVGAQSAQFRRESAVAQAPLPVIGLRGLWEFSPSWYLDGQAQYFTLSFDGFDGDITDLRVGVTRMFGKRFGVGVGYNEFITDVGLDRNRFSGDLKWRYSGAQVFLTASF
jgi:hypothetical protein